LPDPQVQSCNTVDQPADKAEVYEFSVMVVGMDVNHPGILEKDLGDELAGASPKDRCEKNGG